MTSLSDPDHSTMIRMRNLTETQDPSTHLAKNLAEVEELEQEEA